jgi:hypothetical protein
VSKKSDIREMIENSETNDSIVSETGCKLSYVRNIRSAMKRENPKPEVIETKKPETETGNDEVFFEGIDEEEPIEKKSSKTGKEFHNEWVLAKAFECDCGCTLNRTSTYCPHCGTELDWGDI